MQEDVDHMETHGVKASGQVVVNPESQDSKWPVGLVAGDTHQNTAPEFIEPQVPKGRVRKDVLIVNNSFRVIKDKIAIIAPCKTQKGNKSHY